ncbi:MAG: polysaccharide-degrading enzyme [Chitinivibrionales bacterium]|nr:polysaccharide-degrading enzyme [Chitinivibrionales bacterium]
MIKSFAWILTAHCIITAASYEVGPSNFYRRIGDVPWETIDAGDSVLIHYRSDPYHEKWVICAQGTQDSPIVVLGIPSRSGPLPVIDGRNATTRSHLNFWNEPRGIIKIGGANTPADRLPKHIIIENLTIRSGRQPYSFTGRSGTTDYAKNCAAIFVEKGENITIRRCELSDCGNGFFCASGATNIIVEHCNVFDNGVENSIYEHNNYTEVHGITFQYNYFGPLRTDCPGNNLKDRSAGCVIRYNWIYGGNRQLDLVDAGHTDIYNDPTYRSTFVYGNILIERNGDGNSQIIHYGGDSGNQTRYRKGTLYLYNNTIASYRTGNTTLLRLSSDGETADIRNNIIYTIAAGSRLAILTDEGEANLRNNWYKNGRTISFSNNTAKVNFISGNIEGSDPGFADVDAMEFDLATGSVCINAGTDLPDAAVGAYVVACQYRKHQAYEARPADALIDIGAHEFSNAAITESRPRRRTEQSGSSNALRLFASHATQDNLASYTLHGRRYRRTRHDPVRHTVLCVQPVIRGRN